MTRFRTKKLFPWAITCTDEIEDLEGGGVAVIVKHGIDIVTLDQIPDHESLFLKVTFRNATFFCALFTVLQMRTSLLWASYMTIS